MLGLQVQIALVAFAVAAVPVLVLSGVRALLRRVRRRRLVSKISHVGMEPGQLDVVDLTANAERIRSADARLRRLHVVFSYLSLALVVWAVVAGTVGGLGPIPLIVVSVAATGAWRALGAARLRHMADGLRPARTGLSLASVRYLDAWSDRLMAPALTFSATAFVALACVFAAFMAGGASVDGPIELVARSMLGWVAHWGPLGMLVIGMALLGWSRRLSSRGLAQSLPPAGDVVSDDVSPTVMLRSFEADREPVATVLPSGGAMAALLLPTATETLERVLGRSLVRHGPPVAITPPHEDHGRGMHRDRAVGGDWLPYVLGLVRRSAFTAVVLGSSPGLQMEITALGREADLLSGTGFVVPPSLSLDAASPSLEALQPLNVEVVPRLPGRSIVGFSLLAEGCRWYASSIVDEATYLALVDAMVRSADVTDRATRRRAMTEAGPGITIVSEVTLPTATSQPLTSAFERMLRWLTALDPDLWIVHVFVDGAWVAEFELGRTCDLRLSPGHHSLVFAQLARGRLRRLRRRGPTSGIRLTTRQQRKLPAFDIVVPDVGQQRLFYRLGGQGPPVLKSDGDERRRTG